MLLPNWTGDAQKKGTEIGQRWAGKRQEPYPRCQGNNHLPCVVMEAMWWWGGLQTAWSLGYKDSRRQIKLPNLPYLIPTCWELYMSQSLLQFYIPPWVWNMKAFFPLAHTGVITVMPSYTPAPCHRTTAETTEQILRGNRGTKLTFTVHLPLVSSFNYSVCI